jgi:hypothetical protein
MSIRRTRRTPTPNHEENTMPTRKPIRTSRSPVSACQFVVLIAALTLGACAKEPGASTDSTAGGIGSSTTVAAGSDSTGPNAAGANAMKDDAAAMHRRMSAADSMPASGAMGGRTDTTGQGMAGASGGVPGTDKGMSMMDDGMKMMSDGMHMMERGKAMMEKQGMVKDSMTKGMDMMDDGMEMMDKGKAAMSRGKNMVKQKAMADSKTRDGHM